MFSQLVQFSSWFPVANHNIQGTGSESYVLVNGYDPRGPLGRGTLVLSTQLATK